ncbi:NADPH2:quinone reductase [Spinactinospora alkalitolerans]|uniref:NADPH2:quinone reductase n=1 Tax=Spinactinospora alkalitolerans TaxID=687207 RepID=A0A852U664_9ACTN|nr:zinc-binding dehydrogenase [Spinactinospora alkalitolerans]NYE49400.1 NADPH2:quinone reductase [Spinactinospora alkalitolerans]
MRVVQVERFGGPEVLVPGRMPDPVAGPGQAVVGVFAADVMFLDTQIRSGWGGEYFAVSPPYVPGNGVAGRVVSAGEGVDADWIGTDVITETGRRDPGTGLSVAPTDGYAEQVAVPASGLIRLPDGLGPREAVALLHDGPTALMLAEAARIKPDDRVLVAAAAGGAGGLLVQLARAAGARVIGAARGRRKLDLARELGAEAVVDYSEPGWTDRVRQFTDGHGAEVALDGAGGRLGRSAFDVTARGGRFIAYGASGGEFAGIGPQESQSREVDVTTLFDLPSLDAAGKRRLVEEALGHAAAGRIRPFIGQTFDLERASEAHAAIAARSTLGKTLLLT